MKPGDHVIPLYTPECRQCRSCLSGKTNLRTAIRAAKGKGLMPDGTSRFSYEGKTIYHCIGCGEQPIAMQDSNQFIEKDRRIYAYEITQIFLNGSNQPFRAVVQ